MNSGQSITVPIYRKGDKTDCSDYTGTSLVFRK